MKQIFTPALFLLILASAGTVASDAVRPPSNGIAYPEGWEDWASIAMSHRTDNNTVRVILGNDIAVAAARSGNTNPWPDGAILGKVVWKASTLEHWPKAVAPGEFVHAEFMFKDAAKYRDNGTGWGWARWLGAEQKPYGEDAGFSQECIACHTPVKAQDWVFTQPAELP